jgi:hypothetical protein
MAIQLFTPNVISNGTVINGVANFYQSTKPTTRIDSSALAVGDRWYKTNDGTDWAWNGTYWLSTIKRIVSRFREVSNSSNNSFPLYISPWADYMDVPFRKKLFLETITYSVVLNSVGDDNNYRRITIAARTMPGAAPVIYTSTTKIFGSLSRIYVEDEPLNLFYDPTTLPERFGFTFTFVGVGVSPPNGTNPAATMYFREVYP